MRVAVLIDGGHLRVLARKAGHTYDPDFIDAFAHNCVLPTERIVRILYYDCPSYRGVAKRPVSGTEISFDGSDLWLVELGEKELFAIRRGVLNFRGFKARKLPIASRQLTDDDFKPDFEQKGVDMRIGLDMANFSAQRTVDRLILVSGDTDCIPAMKHARINGLQITLIALPNLKIAPELRQHSDYVRQVNWSHTSKTMTA